MSAKEKASQLGLITFYDVIIKLCQL